MEACATAQAVVSCQTALAQHPFTASAEHAYPSQGCFVQADGPLQVHQTQVWGAARSLTGPAASACHSSRTTHWKWCRLPLEGGQAGQVLTAAGNGAAPLQAACRQAGRCAVVAAVVLPGWQTCFQDLLDAGSGQTLAYAEHQLPHTVASHGPRHKHPQYLPQLCARMVPIRQHVSDVGLT